MRFAKALILIWILSPLSLWAQQEEATDKKFEGDASLLTNYVWHGLTQTKRNPAIQTSIYYNLGPNVRFGAWGSNVSYYGRSKANALLKLQGDIDLPMTQNFGMALHYSDNRYFESDDRDGNTFGIEFLIFGYSVLIEQESNWQGTVTKSRYYSVTKSWDVFTRWKWENKIGYTNFETLNQANYFDVGSYIGTRTGVVFWEGGLTFTGDNSQWGDYADYFISFSATVNF